MVPERSRDYVKDRAIYDEYMCGVLLEEKNWESILQCIS